MSETTAPVVNGSVTVGSVTTDNCTDWTWYPSYPNLIYPAQPFYGWPWPTEPAHCMGKAHVFECDHAKKCQCGKIQRVMPKEKK